MDLFCRVTCSYDALKGFFDSYADSCQKLVVYQHDTARTHVHFYAVQCSIKTDAIKTRIKKHLQVTSWDKNNWSFKTASDSGCITYMSKGCLEPVFSKGFTREEILEYKDRWVERTPETSLPKKSTGPTQYDLAMEVLQLVQQKKKDLNELHTIEVYELCVRFAIKVHHTHRKGFCDHSLKKVVQTAYTQIEHCKQSFIEKMVHNYFDR